MVLPFAIAASLVTAAVVYFTSPMIKIGLCYAAAGQEHAGSGALTAGKDLRLDLGAV
ncbi:hypothetical protein GQ600_19186 [Phytophthora cactorum]|nr:hypothetical protein GQ600_19186 [Phytophthora cactorum]